MRPFTVPGVRLAGQSSASGEAVSAKVPLPDPFTRLMACLPTPGTDESPSASQPRKTRQSFAEGPPVARRHSGNASQNPPVEALLHVPPPAGGMPTGHSGVDEERAGGEARGGEDDLPGEAVADPGDPGSALAMLALVNRMAAEVPEGSGAGSNDCVSPGASAPAPTKSRAAAPAPGRLQGAPPNGDAAVFKGPAMDRSDAALLQAALERTDPGDSAALASAPDPVRSDLPGALAPAAPQPPAAADYRADAAVPAASGSSVDHFITRQLDLARDSQWLDLLASDIARTAGKDGRLRFSLHPESLGGLQVEVRHGADGVSVRLSAETDGARAILADAQPRLAAEARAQGVRIAETHVDLAGQFSGNGHRDPNGRPEPLLRTAATPAGDTSGEDQRASRSALPERYA